MRNTRTVAQLSFERLFLENQEFLPTTLWMFKTNLQALFISSLIPEGLDVNLLPTFEDSMCRLSAFCGYVGRKIKYKRCPWEKTLKKS